MKKIVWNILVFFIRLVPFCIRIQLCKIIFAASKESDSVQGCRELFYINEDLDWFLDQCAIKYEGDIHPKHRLMDYHRFFYERIASGEKVLDVGCGVGAVAYSIASHGGLVTGIDHSERDIEKAKKQYSHPALSFVCGDVTTVLPDDEYDVIVLSNVLEHIEDRSRLLSKIASRFHPKRFLIRVPMVNRNWTVSLKKELGLFYYCDPDHRVEYTVQSFQAEMADAGLSVKEMHVCWGEIWAVLIIV